MHVFFGKHHTLNNAEQLWGVLTPEISNVRAAVCIGILGIAKWKVCQYSSFSGCWIPLRQTSSSQCVSNTGICWENLPGLKLNQEKIHPLTFTEEEDATINCQSWFFDLLKHWTISFNLHKASRYQSTSTNYEQLPLFTVETMLCCDLTGMFSTESHR